MDIPYRERRLMFLLAGVNGLYRPPDYDVPGPPSADLDRLKAQAWELLKNLRAAPQVAVGEVSDDDAAFLSGTAVDDAIFTDPEEFAAQHQDDFARLLAEYGDALARPLGDGSAPLWQIFQEDTRGWEPRHRMALLSRYVGFPLWDGLIFPVISLSELPQFTPMGVTQFSPLAASVLVPMPGDTEKLKGVSLHHFSAFVKKEWRENDYLWGRLDGAELILRTLFGGGRATALDPNADLEPERVRAALRAAGGMPLVDALNAILASETDLSEIDELRAHIGAKVEALKSSVGD